MKLIMQGLLCTYVQGYQVYNKIWTAVDLRICSYQIETTEKHSW